MKTRLTKKDHFRRYRLHVLVKRFWKMNAHKREITIPYSETEAASKNKAVAELINRFGYNFQTSITK